MSENRVVWFGIAIVLALGAIYGTVFNDDDEDDRRNDRVELRTCPDYLEVAGPYRRGIDLGYDPAMDWDGDGVSCE